MEIVKLDLEKARDKLAQAKLKLREQMRGGDGKGRWIDLFVCEHPLFVVQVVISILDFYAHTCILYKMFAVL